MKEFIVNCKICGDPYATDAKWKTTCYECYLKSVNPQKYSEIFEYCDITCEHCGNVFIDSPWKKICVVCWISEQEIEKMNDLEDREQFK